MNALAKDVKSVPSHGHNNVGLEDNEHGIHPQPTYLAQRVPSKSDGDHQWESGDPSLQVRSAEDPKHRNRDMTGTVKDGHVSLY